MKIKIIAVGNVKEKHLADGIEVYIKNINKKHTINLVEVKEEKYNEPISMKLAEKVKISEGENILKVIEKEDFPIPLVIQKELITTKKLIELIDDVNCNKNKTPCFIIGGSLGLSSEVINLGKGISFSKMTFPHQLLRFVFLSHLNEVI